jgi:hypothetical protein
MTLSLAGLADAEECKLPSKAPLAEDCCSCTFLAVLCSCVSDLNIFTSEDYVRVRISRDEWVEWYMEDEGQLKETASAMTEAGLHIHSK